MSVRGHVEANLENCQKFEIAAEGTFKGFAFAEEAEISGAFSGQLLAGTLRIRSSARVSGIIRYETIEVEHGGRISGDISSEGSRADARRAFLMSDKFEKDAQDHFTRATRGALASPQVGATIS
jgi:cytoskeletal protein CcmA (bactofilin family)